MKAKKAIIVRYHFLVKVERGGMIVHAASNPQNNCKKIEFFVCLKWIKKTKTLVQIDTFLHWKLEICPLKKKLAY